MADLAEFHLGVEHSAHELFRVAKIFRGLPGLGAYQPVSSGKGGSGSPKRTFQSLLDETLQVHKAIITYCFVMVIVLFVQTLPNTPGYSGKNTGWLHNSGVEKIQC